MPNDFKTQCELEKYKFDLQMKLEEKKLMCAINLESFKSAVMIGQNAIRTAFLLNAGSSVALITFITRLVETQKDKIPAISTVLYGFITGAFLVCIGSASSYISQCYYTYGTEDGNRLGNRMRNIAIGAILCSFVVFFISIIKAATILRNW